MSNVSRLLFPNGKFTPILAASFAGLAGYFAWNRQPNDNLSQNSSPLNRLNVVHKSFLHNYTLNSEAVAAGICGRVKCMKPDQLTHLSSNFKPYSWVFGSNGVYSMSQCQTDYDKLIHLGFEKDWIELQLRNGYSFNLYLFPEKSENYTAVWATWNGVLDLLKATDPQIYERMEPFTEELQKTCFEDIESKSDFEFMDVEDVGPKDHRYLTKERFLSIEKEQITLVDARFLLYCFLGLSKYFDGDGYTMDKNGDKGCKEYLIKNMRLDAMEELRCVELNVQIPKE